MGRKGKSFNPYLVPKGALKRNLDNFSIKRFHYLFGIDINMSDIPLSLYIY
jgi:hypothetical protein